MALRTLRYEHDELLRKKSKPVKEINEKTKILIDDMVETMKNHEGIGLAAPQVGVLRRVVVIEVNDVLYELINPEIIETDGTQCTSEGCLSIPGVSGKVERPAFVKIRALNRDGEEIILEGEEVLAVAFCHEIDHLDGVLYIDKVIEMDPDEDEDGDEDEDEDE